MKVSLLARRSSICALLLFIIAGQVAAATPALATTTSAERTIAHDHNATRAAHHLRTLSLRSNLSDIARRHSRAMASHYRLSHENVTAIVREMRRRAGGENVGYARSLGALYRMWLRSPEHRRNILDPRWRTIGVGIVRAHGWYWGTVLFLN